MPIITLQKRLWLLSLVLLIGFALRLHNLVAADLNVDETWSYINSFYLAYPSGYTVVQILAPEPNNALHLILLSLDLSVLPSVFGARWLSAIAGVLTIPLTARIAFRLFGQRAALIASIIVTLAYAPITFSQIARPYALATMLAVFSLLLWLENRSRLNMLASALVPLAHIGAMPVVFAQDLLTLWRIWRGRRIRKLDWIVRRIPVYAMFLLIVYMTYLRREIHVISSGQPAPAPADVINHALNVISSGFPALSAGTLLFLFGVVVPLALITIRRRDHLPDTLGVPLLWIGITYTMLVAGAVLSDGPIKWVHISHVAIALALLMAGLLAQARWEVIAVVLLAYCLVSSASLLTFYQHPDHYWSDVRAEVDRFRQNEAVVYAQQPTVLWALQINNPEAAYIDPLPAKTVRPTHYLYIETDGWLPEAPSECNPDSLWSNGDGLRLLNCNYG